MEGENTKEFDGYLSSKTRRKIKMRLDKWLAAIQLHVVDAEPKTFTKVYPTFVNLELPSKKRQNAIPSL